MSRYTLHGSPHSLPTYKVASMLRMSGEPFLFRYVSFQKGIHRTPEFQTLSRWGQVPVLVEDERAYVQSAAIVEHLSEKLDRFKGPDLLSRQAVREWLFWNVDVLFPAVFGCYAAELDRMRSIPFSVVQRKLPTPSDFQSQADLKRNVMLLAASAVEDGQRAHWRLLALLVSDVMPKRHTCDIRFLYEQSASLKPAEIHGFTTPISDGISV